MIDSLLRFASDLWMLIHFIVVALTGFVQGHWLAFLVLAVIIAWLSIIDPANTEGK